MTPVNSATFEDNILGTLARELKHDYVRVRRSAIDRAAKMLASNQYPDQVMALLKSVSISDPNTSIRDHAEQVVETYRNIYPEKESPNHGLATIDVSCPQGHANHFEKNDICSNLGKYWRRSVIRGELIFQEVRLTCQYCGEDVIFEVDCDFND